MSHGEVLQVSKGQDVLFVQFFMGAQKMMAADVYNGTLPSYTLSSYTLPLLVPCTTAPNDGSQC